MSTITLILEADGDGTVHLPVPAELRGGKIEVTATLKAANGQAKVLRASADMVRRRKEALMALRNTGGLRDVVPDPVAWQKELRQERPLPGRD